MSHVAYDPTWPAQFDQERPRLLAALGEMTAGGIVENVQHVGATSIPGMAAAPCVDIALSVSPFPLEAAPTTALLALGYAPVPGYTGKADTGKAEQRFGHASGTLQLLISEAGSEAWLHHLLLRDYLRHDAAARARYAQRSSASTVKEQLIPSLLSEAQLWWIDHHGFANVQAVAQELVDFPAPWYISSGWALDLFLGQVTRVHHDVDVVVARADQLTLQAYMMQRGWKFVTPLNQRLEPWPPHMRLELPRHQAHAHRDGDFIDFLISDIDHGVWHFRRNPAIVRTTERMSLRTDDGIPFLAPELVLLFKSKTSTGPARAKDHADFAKVYAQLEAERRAWLAWALVVSAPEHPWLVQLRDLV
jgi:GrpB-like predicted nucleotidyltransferase (UPF0157 family)